MEEIITKDNLDTYTQGLKGVLSSMGLAILSASGSSEIPNDYYITYYLIDQSDPFSTANSIIMETPSMYDERKVNIDGTDVYVNVIKRIWAETKLYCRDTTKEGFVIRELDRNDKTKFTDGTSSTHPSNNTLWEYYQKLPEFWYKINAVGKDIFKVAFTMHESVTDGSWNHWEGNTFVGIYDSSKTSSSSDYRSLRGVSYTHQGSPSTYPAIPYYSCSASEVDNVGVSYDTIKVLTLLYFGWFCHDNINVSKIQVSNTAAQDRTGRLDEFGMNVVYDGSKFNFFGIENLNYIKIKNVSFGFNAGTALLVSGSTVYSHTINSTSWYTSGIYVPKIILNGKSYYFDAYVSENYTSYGSSVTYLRKYNIPSLNSNTNFASSYASMFLGLQEILPKLLSASVGASGMGNTAFYSIMLDSNETNGCFGTINGGTGGATSIPYVMMSVSLLGNKSNVNYNWRGNNTTLITSSDFTFKPEYTGEYTIVNSFD